MISDLPRIFASVQRVARDLRQSTPVDRYVLKICLVLLAAALAGAPHASESVPPYLEPFDATYVGRFSGAKVEMQIQLRRLGNPASYLYQRASEPRGIVRLFRREGAYECSWFEHRNGEFVPIEYQFLDGKSGGGQSASIDFDWEHDRATSTYEREELTFELDKPYPLDRMSEEIAVRSLLARGIEFSRLRIIERNGLHDTHYDVLGPERIEIDNGSYDTQRIRRRRGDSTRTTDYWFAAELNWLPVRIERMRKGKSQGTAVLRDLTWLDSTDETSQARGNVTPVCP